MPSSLMGKLETDIKIKVPASKFHEIFKHKPHHISNVSSDFIQGCELHEGEWGTMGFCNNQLEIFPFTQESEFCKSFRNLVDPWICMIC
ncbi:hypothetical protein FEM48_Zijuj10G0123400 [Ziziphus jujuba var. spinosa]|uniref:Bet v I/Major latex protein domain-containing protein n=1 Tax=Ziziphus jujuba var. spinosa TaxID=714518 RepID=A0A978UNC6_ZIZJJ|nr:hypothetical protein FEM48_Zijuj10G0123400 [Ziziphus jujuba var. spinosa]